MKEAPVSQRARLALIEAGGFGMRNNVGACQDETGRHIRFGLMNESKAVNEQYKSSDLIDCIPVLIKPHHVGRVFGLFFAGETKRSDWKLQPGDKRAQAQLRFINLIRKNGGAADFIRSADDVRNLLEVYK